MIVISINMQNGLALRYKLKVIIFNISRKEVFLQSNSDEMEDGIKYFMGYCKECPSETEIFYNKFVSTLFHSLILTFSFAGMLFNC